MAKKRILSILGTRPELVKLSPLLPLLDKHFQHKLVHTGQHYDEAMRGVFFRELKLRPALQLKSANRGASKSTSVMVAEIQNLIADFKPDIILVQGDTNSAAAGAIAGGLCGVPVAHVEAGCRSGNLAAPEERNRRLIDRIASLYFAPDRIAFNNLVKEGIPKRKLILSGNTAIEALERNIHFVDGAKTQEPYLLLTLHRAENVDNAVVLRRIFKAINKLADEWVILLPIHPRTRARLREFKIPLHSHILTIPPQGYLSFLKLLREARAVLTDSGGIQEEAAGLEVPCFVLREETEWVRLLDSGRVFLLGTGPQIVPGFKKYFNQAPRGKAPFERGASKKILAALKRFRLG